MRNLPCHGCWWIEGGRCYQDRLADIHGYGLGITDALITACLDRGVHQRKSAIYGRLEAHLRAAGIEVVHIGIGKSNG